MEKFIIQDRGVVEEGKIVRVDPEAGAILNELTLKSGRSITFLASEAIKFAAKHAEIQVVNVKFNTQEKQK